MIEQETVLALIEAKEVLEETQGYLHQIRLDQHGEEQEIPRKARIRVGQAVGLIESILAKGR